MVFRGTKGRNSDFWTLPGRGLVGLVAVLLVAVVPDAATVSPAAAGGAGCKAPGVRIQRLGRLGEGLAEASGLAASRKYPGVGWVIRDSGHTPSIYSIRIVGGRSVVREVKVLGADNRDWEDVTYSVGPDGRGRLWIVESMQSHRDPFIYEIVEPNPLAKTVRVKSRHRYRYPGADFQNTEASFWYDGHLVLATKSSPTKLYRFDSLKGSGTHQPQYVGALEGAPRISVLRPAPDHSALIASSHQTLWVFEGDGKGSRLADFVGNRPATRKISFPNDNVEAGDYFPSGSCSLVMLSEKKNAYRVFAG